jgi:CBS domain-containing protein/gamma-glutamyl:cysteine ligase YbdK (ATP-grasp superfamily)
MQKEKVNLFKKHLLEDISVLGKMMETNAFSKSKFRIGAEQEMCIVDTHANVLPINQTILKNLNHAQFTTELAKFNLEINLLPRDFGANCLQEMESELLSLFQLLNHKTDEEIRFYLGGIIPSLRYIDIDLENITPLKRYFELVNNILKSRGEEYELRIQGEDELLMKHNSVFIEAATTSFQIHLEVPPHLFASFYNISQYIAAPLLAISANSPLFLRKKLWHETRIALLRQSIDVSKTTNTIREAHSRVTFGNRWVQESALELFHEDISLHRVLMVPDLKETSREQFAQGITPDLKALQLYNSTIYRWNRPVYGVLNGEPHLRIENRILPAGPTVVDQMANAAFWYGLMFGMQDEKIATKMPFATVKNNFLQAARNGIFAKIKTANGKEYAVTEIIEKELLPIAAEGLQKMSVDSTQAAQYLKIIKERNQTGQNGAKWTIDAFESLKNSEISPTDALATLVDISIQNQKENIPVHRWEIPIKRNNMKKNINEIIIEECMDKDLFTVRPEDIIQLAADMMDWQKIRFIMVENEQGDLEGIVSSRNLLKNLNGFVHHDSELPVSIEDIMVRNPITAESNQKLSEALSLMKKYQIGCLPILQNKKLVGIITEQTFLNVFADLMG